MGDPDVESNSLELWSFRIMYHKSAGGEREVQSLEASLGNEEVYDPSLDIHGSVISLLRRVYDQCGELPQLPGEKPINLDSCDSLANSRSKMTAIFSPVYCTRRTDGSQRAMWQHNLSHLYKDLLVGNPTQLIWASSADIITSKLLSKESTRSLLTFQVFPSG